MTAVSQSNLNNHGPLYDSTGDDNNVHSYTRDSTYYYPDGSAVFLIENILFKLHVSLILPPRLVSPTSGDDGERHSIDVENVLHQLAGSSDGNPITIPGITASQFRNYLFALLGRPSDPEYLALQTDARDINKHNRALLVRYLDISCLARRFGMSELEHWARSQLELTLTNKSRAKLADSNWDKDALLQLNSYARSTGAPKLISITRHFIQYFMSISTDKQAAGREQASSNVDTLVQLYKDPGLSEDDPALFGCVFASILSLGHRSVAWSKLTPKDRAVLYAAQVQLTAISDELASVDWLRAPANSLTFLNIETPCPECKRRIPELWRETFGQCGNLDSRDPLKDVSALARLPQYRRNFMVKCNPIHPPKPHPGHTLDDKLCNLAAYTDAACPSFSLDSVIREIDRRITMVYIELARRYQTFVSEISTPSQTL